MRALITVFMTSIAMSLGIAQDLRPLPDRVRSIDGDSKRYIAGPITLTGTQTSSPLDSFIVAHMNSVHVPGLSATIVKHGKVVWKGNYGLADIALNKPVTDSTSFMLASISKTITATALMQLCESGRFSLDDSINKYLPFVVRNPNVPGIPITIRMLLTHTSSIQDNWDMEPYSSGDYPMALGTYLQAYLTPGGQFYNSNKNFYTYAPGATFNYCNVGVALCGYLVEAISGIPFDRYCRDSIFVPLQMTHTAWFLRDLDTTLIARPYTYSSGAYVDNGLYGYPEYPDGQLRTTAVSLSRFLLSHIGYGCLNGVRVLDSSTVRLLRTVQYPAVEPNQGLIWYRESRDVFGGLEVWGHTGGDYGVTTSMYLSEPDTVGVIVLQNAYATRLPVVLKLFQVADTIETNVRLASWTNQSSGTTTNLAAVSFCDANTGIAVGTDGTILRTINGGAAWTSQSSGTTNGLYGVSTVNANSATSVGLAGTILHTTNGGTTWAIQTSGTTHDLTAVSFSDVNTGFAVGFDGTILRTTDGGTTWTNQASGVTSNLYGVSSAGAGSVTVVGDLGTILHTTDGGTLWTSQSSGTATSLHGASLIDANHGTVVGYQGTILRTTDGGTTWTNPPSATTSGLMSVSFSDRLNGTAVGLGGTIVRTFNGGVTWKQQLSGTGYGLIGVSFTDGANGTAVGFLGTIVRTTTGGVTGIKGKNTNVNEVPTQFTLSQNYPNPFNPLTNVDFQLRIGGYVTLKVFDLLGREVATLVNELKNAGRYTARWDASRLSSGVYFYTISAGAYRETKRMILMK